jgi:hypothetical protein
MLDVHPPHAPTHTWRDFFLHIATIVVGLLIAIGLEQSVEYFHHRHEAKEARAMLRDEYEHNRLALRQNQAYLLMQFNQHRAALITLQHVRSHTVTPQDRLVYVEVFDSFTNSAWKTVHESGAAAFLSLNELNQYANLYEKEADVIAISLTSKDDLQKATSVLNDPNTQLDQPWTESDEHRDLEQSTERLSGHPDLNRLTPTQIDRIELGFQQAISDDRKLDRWYIAIAHDYADVDNPSPGKGR